MDLQALQGGLGIYAGTFVICFLSGVIPLINAEVYLVAVSAVAGEPALVLAVIFLAALGQMAAKAVLALAAHGTLSLPLGRYQAKLEAARAKVARWKEKPLLITFASASLGVPPLYLTSLLVGVLGIRLWSFLAVGMVGRLLRFGVVAAIPQIVRAW